METTKLYGGSVELTLDNRHSYWASIDGGDKTKCIGTTSISGILDKIGLRYYTVNTACDFLLTLSDADQLIDADSIETARKLHLKKTKEAADSGSSVHDWCEQYAKAIMNGTAKPVVNEDDDKIFNGTLAFMRFVTDYKVKFRACERLVYSVEHGYAGKLDVEIQINNDGKWRLGDYKTSGAKKAKKPTDVCSNPLCGQVGCGGVYPEVRFQTALYQNACEEEGTTFDGDRLVIRLDKDSGEYQVHQLDNYEKDRDTALAMLVTKRRLLEIG